MMLPFLGAIARNVDLDCMKYFLGLGLIIKVGMSIVGQFTGYLNITVRQSRQSGVARATCPD